jgi:hypothetical protein
MGQPNGLSYKSVAVGGVSEVKDEGDGIVTAYVSLTGVEDNVKDVIEPGAYKRTLTKRTPKGVWGHQWLTPTSKTIAADELPPGHADLPKELSNGEAWPKEAGALRIKMQFNLGTTRGREAYSDVTFFGPQQEWSIGYVVPPGASFKDDKGVRHIKDLDLFEYSPVLFGAMSHARTASVKDAQIGQKLLNGITSLEVKSLEEALELHRKEIDVTAPEDGDGSDFEGDEVVDEDAESEDDEELEEDEESEEDDEEELDEEDEAKSLAFSLAAKLSVKELRDIYDAIGKVIDVAGAGNDAAFLEYGMKALVEAKAVGYNTITEAVDAIDVQLDHDDAKSLRGAALLLDDALSTKNEEAAYEAAQDLMDVLEKVMTTTEEDDLSLKAVARTMADKTATEEDDEEEEDEEGEGDEETDNWEDEEEDDEGGEKSKEDWRKYKKKTVTVDGIEYKSMSFAGREFGMPVGGGDLDTKTRQEVFVGTLPLSALLALDVVLDGMRGNTGLKALVAEELDYREYTGELTDEVKMRMPVVRGGGQNGRGGGRHRQAAEGRTPGPGRNFGETGRVAKPSAKRVKKAVKGVKKAGTSKKTVNRVTGSGRPVQTLRKSDYSASQRETAARKGNAMADGSFPINNETDLKNAIKACGRAKDADAAKAHIKKRAKAMGKEALIPDEWKTTQIDTTELKSMEQFLYGL